MFTTTFAKRANTKPPQGAGINLCHPLAAQILSAHLLNDHSIRSTNGTVAAYDLVRRGLFRLSSTAGATWIANAAGKAVRCPATTENLGMGTESAANRFPTTSCTVALIRRKLDTTFRSSATFGNVSATATHRLEALVPNGTAGVTWQFGGNTGTTNQMNWPQAGGYAATTDPESWVFVAGTRGMAIYYQGLLRMAHTTPITRVASASTFGLNTGATGAGDLQEFNAFFLFEREWTAADVAWWFAEPWAFVEEPLAQRYYIPATVAATGGGRLVGPNRLARVA